MIIVVQILLLIFAFEKMNIFLVFVHRFLASYMNNDSAGEFKFIPNYICLLSGS